MPEPSDREILIRVETKVDQIHFEVTQPGGRVPRLEEKVEKHDARINSWMGERGAVRWALGVLAALFVTLAGVVLAHVLGNKP